MTPNKRDLKAYSRFDGTGRIVPGSTVLRRNKPKVGTWIETQAYECCVPPTCPEPLIMEILPSEGFFEFGMRSSSTNTVRGTIDWGDGTTESFNFTGVSSTSYISHNYSSPDYIPQTVRVTFTSVSGFRRLEIGDGNIVGTLLSVTNLPTVFAGSSIEQVDADGTNIQSLDVSNLPIIELYALECSNLTYLNVQGCTSLDNTELYSDNFTALDFSGCASLVTATVYENYNLSTLIIDDCDSLNYLEATDCDLNASAVNYILVTLDNLGNLNGDVFLNNNLSGTNAAPTGAGITAKNNLIAKGWQVITE
jgi:hypothetical protein